MLSTLLKISSKTKTKTARLPLIFKHLESRIFPKNYSVKRRLFSTTSTPPSTPTPTTITTPPTSLFGKGIALIKEYGAVGLGVYFSLWFIPFGTSFILFDLNNNFGQDPVAWVEYFAGKENRIKLWEQFGMKPDDNLSPRVISLLLAYLVCEVIETPRIAATVFLTPVVKRYFVSSTISKNALVAVSIPKTSEDRRKE